MKRIFVLAFVLLAVALWASTASQQFTLTIAPPPLSITTTALSSGQVGVPYSDVVTASGGVPPYTWSATGLPAGLAISTNPDNTGTISGTPTAVCACSVTITVTDAQGNQVAKPSKPAPAR